MKFAQTVLLIALLSFLCGLIAPWWTIAIVSFLVALLIVQTPGRSFLSGFLAIFLLWGTLSWWIDSANAGLLSSKIAVLFPIGGHGWVLIVLTAVVGGLVSGLAALTASFARTKKG